MSTFALKLFAIIVMLIDHIGAIFISPATHPEIYVLFRGIGRLAFPIFVFLIVEGFYHTKDVRKYLKRLGIFAFVSELPFDIAFYQMHYGTSFVPDLTAIFDNGFNIKLLANMLVRLSGSQNIFFTLFLGLALIYMMSLVEDKFKTQFIISSLIDAVITIAFCAAAKLLKTDYSIAGILLFVFFYIFRGSKLLISICIFIISGTVLSNIKAYNETGNILYIISMLATFSIIPIALYNGKKGKNAKYLFYIFYPAHLLILFLVSQFIS